jgi:hypothetical protein
VKLTTHLHLVPRSRNEWRYTSTPQHAFLAWCLVKKQILQGVKGRHKNSCSFLPSTLGTQNRLLSTIILCKVRWYCAELHAGLLGVRVRAGARNFSPHHRTQTGSGAHPASYTMGTRDSFHGCKAAGVVKLTTHLHLMPRSRVRGSIPPLPQ